MINQPYPEVEDLLRMIGETGQRICEINASEGSSGNISVYVGWPIDPGPKFNNQKTVPLPVDVPELAGKMFIVTGSGRRLREVIHDPDENLGFLKVGEDGKTGTLFTADCCQFQNLTSEWNTHLVVHQDQIKKTGTNFHAVVHGQPLFITFLSHIPAYQNELTLNRKLLRWEPEAIVNLPEGIGFVPFHVPSSEKLMKSTREPMQNHRLSVWAKHGVVARSEVSAKHASDLIEYMETAAHYEYLNLTAGQPAEGLTGDEIKEIASLLKIQQKLF